MVRETSLCGLGQSAPNPVLSTLRYFRDEYLAHVVQGRARPGSARWRRWRRNAPMSERSELSHATVPAVLIPARRWVAMS